ncbi:MAG: PASTA domain-containing protein [Bacteroidales bacterium]|nr:PASTA domain-containing protein [Bacteroidales bacterium]
MKIKHSIIIISVNLLIMLLIVLGVTFLWLPGWLNDITGHNEKAIVPEVVGKTVDVATAELEAVGLRPMVIDTIYGDGCQPGEVIEQLPEGNLPVKPNRIVYLTINAFDVQKVLFPDVIQWSSRQAISHLRELKLIADSVKYEPYEFDDLVLSVTHLETGEEMNIGELYPIRTHLVVHVGSTTADLEVKNDSTENSFFE